MENSKQQILENYISYLHTTGKSYNTIRMYIKHVKHFLLYLPNKKPLAITSRNRVFLIDFTVWLTITAIDSRIRDYWKLSINPDGTIGLE